MHTTLWVSSIGYEPGAQVVKKNQNRLFIYISLYLKPSMSSNSSPYLMEPFDPVPDLPTASASASGYAVLQQLASAERRPESGPAER